MSLNIDEFIVGDTTLTVEAGGRQWTMRLFRSIGDYDRFIKLYEGRQNAYRLGKGAVRVTLPDELLTENVRANLPDVEESNGRHELVITSDNELMTATVLEYALIEPELSWPEAVLLCKLNGPLALKLAEQWNRAVTTDEHEAQKKTWLLAACGIT